MVDPVQTEWLGWIQASVGWASLAARAVQTRTSSSDAANTPDRESPSSLIRLRATITIDIDARDAEDAERQSEAIRGQFERLNPDHPSATLLFQRRKPRAGRRAPAPAVVVSPYVDD